MKTIKTTISPDGSKASIEVEGVKGPSCTEITKNLSDALGTVIGEEKTPEFFESAVDNVSLTGR